MAKQKPRSVTQRVLQGDKGADPDPKTVDTKYFKRRKAMAAAEDRNERSGVNENNKFGKIIATVKKLQAVRAKTAKAKAMLPKEKTERLADVDKRIKKLQAEAKQSAARFKKLHAKYQKERKK